MSRKTWPTCEHGRISSSPPHCHTCKAGNVVRLGSVTWSSSTAAAFLALSLADPVDNDVIRRPCWSEPKRIEPIATAPATSFRTRWHGHRCRNDYVDRDTGLVRVEGTRKRTRKRSIASSTREITDTKLLQKRRCHGWLEEQTNSPGRTFPGSRRPKCPCPRRRCRSRGSTRCRWRRDRRPWSASAAAASGRRCVGPFRVAARGTYASDVIVSQSASSYRFQVLQPSNTEADAFVTVTSFPANQFHLIGPFVIQ